MLFPEEPMEFSGRPVQSSGNVVAAIEWMLEIGERSALSGGANPS